MIFKFFSQVFELIFFVAENLLFDVESYTHLKWLAFFSPIDLESPDKQR